MRRRDGRLVAFDAARIEAAVTGAAREAGSTDPALPERVAEAVVDTLSRRYRREPPTVEQIQDVVERELIDAGHAETVRAYLVYRRHRAELRDAKALLEVRDELKLSLAAVTVLRERYLLTDARGRPVESTGELLDRSATFVAQAEEDYRAGSSQRWASRFSALLRGLEFLPNSPTLMNAGTPIGLLSGCVVLPVEDSLRSIFSSLGHSALIHQAGGGTGYAFSHLRPRGDRIVSTGGTASGPLSFLRLYDHASEVIQQGGRRRGAGMAVLDVSHPDIREFLAAKANAPGELSHFNLSVGVSDAFLRAAESGGTQWLVNPRSGRKVARVPAAELLDAMCEAAHRSGDPGLLFLDTINRANPLPRLGRIEATNPCGEVPLLPYESCNLGSLNLARFATGGRVDWDRLGEAAELSVRFLDDVIDVSRYPFPELEQATKAGRKIGLGFMGLAELLASLGIPYDSDDAVRLAGRVASHVRRHAHAASERLARERGPYPAFERGARPRETARRHAQVTSVAPTGTISLIAGTTSGIEPMFAIAYVRTVLGRQLLETNPHFERLARDRGFYTDELAANIARTGGVRDNPNVPADVRAAYPTALEIAPYWHLRMQAAVQRHVDAAVSKTINLPAGATVGDVRSTFLAAWRAKVKGITVYRYGSKEDQVLTLAEPAPTADTTFTGGCAGRSCEF
ncbi:adenosylcobalamin-dependent ribonucleoside-diphosphate reductase [Saccharomonospora amisosensis]|uniref:adenosylcobalamin-dependent ribonucleoside-diphosphate reductase n=1 Tax=Saccharomonospora amisosensis TaxID=1128677 RepID=UPI001ABB4B1D|nr:adenosylcobalamin-dependent ribonucleoside-diphosphate reductase [Saccharomonospora amisosensis]